MGKTEYSKWKGKAWDIFSLWVRLSHADDQGVVKCVTCGVPAMWKGEGMQAGHYVDGRNNTVLFDEMLVHPQCFKCNSKRPGCKAGNKVQYTKYMMERYGMTFDDCEALDRKVFAVKKIKVYELKEIHDKYKELYENELLKRGLI